MKNPGFAGIIGTGLASAVLGLAALGLAGPAGAAGTDRSVDDVVADLEDQGYLVDIDNPNDVPLDEAHVTDIRTGKAITEWVRDQALDRYVDKTIYTPVTVEVS